ncbi:hypothetical protein BD626DRAFT_592433 [Schizophyllum amplum]|uniref:SET domain-containing protein n=1 Tax=Schizophyllum amplum TaxID=97359 RepID=A0A550CES2_9AGAR|nr:hypothetical protein BD626DRAFT_592433 [Auriculariopsis ampla]
MSAAKVERATPPLPVKTEDTSEMTAVGNEQPSASPATAVSPGTSTPTLAVEPPEPTPEPPSAFMLFDSASPAPSSATLKEPSRASSKASTTPPPQAQPKKGKASKAAPNPPQFIGHLPVARAEALRQFKQIQENWYQYAKLGKSREAMEGSTCDCDYEEGDNLDHACGARSNCINRLTQVECLEEECHCRQFCQNQRFQRKEYADIEIVQTEKKGFGLRAERDLPKDSFIYEYVGDVVSSPSFKKRMRDYAKEGIQHFYFMMLQKDEFIDATKSGGIGRFANHSCSPNCYVAKWTVGDRVRMGIFAKRSIKKHEELTFNYNVDRYGCLAPIPPFVGPRTWVPPTGAHVRGRATTTTHDLQQNSGVQRDGDGTTDGETHDQRQGERGGGMVKGRARWEGLLYSSPCRPPPAYSLAASAGLRGCAATGSLKG